MWSITTYNPQETLELGFALGKQVPPDVVIALTGDLGAGKTMLASGIALGLDVEERITSPTFTIVNQYLSGRLPFNHMDIYRINHEDELWELGIEEYFDRSSVSVVEWPEMLGDILPPEHVKINMIKQYDPEGNQWRVIQLSATDAENEDWLKEALKGYAHLIH